MSFEKIPKDIWLNLSQEEKDYYTFEFNKSIEKRKKLTLIATRTIALLCIFVLFWIGYVQFKAIGNYNEIIDEYGSNGYCYLCGQYTLKSCDCTYFTNDFIEENRELFDNYSSQVGEYNAQECSSMKVNDNNDVYNRIPILINMSELN